MTRERIDQDEFQAAELADRAQCIYQLTCQNCGNEQVIAFDDREEVGASAYALGWRYVKFAGKSGEDLPFDIVVEEGVACPECAENYQEAEDTGELLG
jgi:hypothetical protein